MTRILVIDDSPDIRALLQAELQHAGYTVQVAETGRAALKIQKLFRADLVITDLFMPDGDGFEVIAALRQKIPAAKIIAMSAARPMDTDYLASAKKAGADATVHKPLQMRALIGLVKSMAP